MTPLSDMHHNQRPIGTAGESWDRWFEGQGVSADFMTTRDQPADQERAAL